MNKLHNCIYSNNFKILPQCNLNSIKKKFYGFVLKKIIGLFVLDINYPMKQ